MEKSSKIIGVIVFGFIVPVAIILPLVSRQEREAQNIAGIRDYKAGRYDLAIQELDVYLKVHPLVFRDHMHMRATSDYAEKYLGLALMKQQRYAEAGEAFRNYAHCSDGCYGNYWLGQSLLRCGKTSAAKEAFSKVIEEDQEQASSRHSYYWSDLAHSRITEIDQNVPATERL